jgi:hypothetical protein
LVAKNRGAVPQPTISLDDDASARGNTLFVDGAFDIGILMVVVHDEYSRAEQDVFLQFDVILAGQSAAAADLASVPKNN